MKIKVIDIMNKIHNEEAVPKKIMYDFKTYFYDENIQDYTDYDRTYGLFSDLLDKQYGIFSCLNDEVEILEEEKKIPEKLDMVLLGQCDNWTQKYNTDTKKMENTHIELNPYVIDTIRENTLEIQHKFNEIIDYLKSKGE